jgi:hypothetical protein
LSSGSNARICAIESKHRGKLAWLPESARRRYRRRRFEEWKNRTRIPSQTRTATQTVRRLPELKAYARGRAAFFDALRDLHSAGMSVPDIALTTGLSRRRVCDALGVKRRWWYWSPVLVAIILGIAVGVGVTIYHYRTSVSHKPVLAASRPTDYFTRLVADAPVAYRLYASYPASGKNVRWTQHEKHGIDWWAAHRDEINQQYGDLVTFCVTKLADELFFKSYTEIRRLDPTAWGYLAETLCQHGGP